MSREAGKPLIFIVDDVPENIQIALSQLKESGIEFAYATSGSQALSRIANRPPDLILLDVMMPGMSGFETLQKLKQHKALCSIPVIFLTARGEPEDITRGFELGAVDYITKPFYGAELRSRVNTHLELSSYRRDLEQTIRKRTRENELLKDIIIVAMGELAEYRDPETGGHLRRTRSFVRLLAETLVEQGQFLDILTPEYIILLYKTAPLHDIGKVAIHDSILRKPTNLTDEARNEMKQHALYGEKVITKLMKIADADVPLLQCAKDIVGSHHERYDGNGYPRGLSGEAIPLAGRIMAIADVYDALASRRPYKKAFSHEKSLRIMRGGRGTHFDPVVFDAFLSVAQQFAGIARQYKDE